MARAMSLCVIRIPDRQLVFRWHRMVRKAMRGVAPLALVFLLTGVT